MLNINTNVDNVMDKETFEYKFGHWELSRIDLLNRLNEFGADGWEIDRPVKTFETNSFDAKGNMVLLWEIFMKRKTSSPRQNDAE